MTIDMARYTAMMLRRAPDSQQVVWGSLVTYGLFRSVGELESVEGGGMLPVNTRSLLIAATALPGLKQNHVITIGGVSYSVRSPALPVENGDMVRYLVVPVS